MNYLVLVNKDHLIKDKDLNQIKLKDDFDVLNDPIKVEEKSLEAYLELKSFLKKKNIEIGIDSAYRKLSEQQEIIDEFMIKYGEEYTKQYVAPIGTSEHHTGLAIDLSIKKNGEFLIDNEDLMANETTFLEIHQYLHKFGFILRYPKKKEKITGYSYEPWHIRYVGEIPAGIIYHNNLTLEEYLETFSAVLLVNKPKDITSRDVVNRVSRMLGIKKIGHTGTLDPLAEGVLVLTIGKATKLSEELTALEKEYQVGVEVGKLTDTLDITGEIVKEKKCTKKIDFEQLCKSFTKTYLQEVPLYSAVKVEGKKLYEYARNHEEIKLPKKEVTIYDIELLEINQDSFSFKCRVSKGTYIRSLIRDMGLSIGQYFSMNKLTRTKQGKFLLKDAYTLEQIKNNHFDLLKIEEVLDYPSITMDEVLYQKVVNGCRIKNKENIVGKILMKDQNNKIISIYKSEGDTIKPWKKLI